MSAHTPGPWTFSKWEQFGDTRFYVAQEEGAPYTPDYSDVDTLIAETVSNERVAIQLANARVIAAAPDLLEALWKMDRILLEVNPNLSPEYLFSQIQKAFTIGRAAIAKATKP